MDSRSATRAIENCSGRDCVAWCTASCTLADVADLMNKFERLATELDRRPDDA